MEELRIIASRRKIDIISIQEPYTNLTLKNPCNMGLNIKTLYDNKKFSSNKSINQIKTVIAVLNSELTLLKLEKFSNTHFVCVEISKKNQKFYLVNGYFQYSDNIEKYLNHLSNILADLKGENILITLDANAKSALWFNDITDDRGLGLEELIAQHNLYIINKPSALHTYSSESGKSNIDVTLTTQSCLNSVQNWEILDHVTSSDHNLIEMTLYTPVTNDTPTAKTRYNLKWANWKKFQQILNTEIPNSPQVSSHTNNADELAENITRRITAACDFAIPRKKRFTKSVPWWNSELESLKATVRKLRRQLQQTRNPSQRTKIIDKLRPARNKYTALIRKSKLQSWRNFVTCNGNQEPWGIIYKLQTNKIQINEVCSSIQTTGSQTTTWEESAALLLNSVIPDDDPTLNSEWQRNVSTMTAQPPDTENSPPFTTTEVGNTIRRLKNRKAPGNDYLESEIIKQAWPFLTTELTHLYNSCINTGTFPTIWKNGIIKLLLKSEEKLATDPKSYRPICLLPILGKILEKLISNRLQELFDSHPLSANEQYGFRRGRSTEDAVVKMRELVKNSSQKYVVILFFDISGAFDNAWWPAILSNLIDRNCPRNLYNVLNSYLSNRTVEIQNNSFTVSKIVNKGCPQGSILGPKFWNLIFDDLLNKIREDNFDCVAYADDLMVPISGNSRNTLETKANQVASLIHDWCTKHKLTLSKEKSEMLLAKGFLDINRPPTVKIAGQSIKMKRVVKYLGISFGPRLNISPHIDHISAKSKKIFHSIARIAKTHWGLNYRTLNILYKGVFIPVVSYAASGWYDRTNVHHIRKLFHAQRHALLRITKAYRTTSTDALGVLASAMPIDLVLEERRAIYLIRHNREAKIADTIFPPNPDNTDSDYISRTIDHIKNRTIELWQQRWTTSQKGRITFKFIPDVKKRLKENHITPDHYSAQLLTGHGRIGDKLKQLKITDNDLCRCQRSDSVHHILFECPILRKERETLREKVSNENITWPCSLPVLTTQKAFKHFQKFATRAMTNR